MNKLQAILLGGATFGENEEYFQFRFRFFNVLLYFSALCSVLFIVADHSGANTLTYRHVFVQKVHVLISFVSLFVLYKRKNMYYWVAIPYAIFCFFVFISALVYVPHDELRIIWFFLNLPGVYLLLGNYAGIIATLCSIFVVLALNSSLSFPYSGNAMATALVAFLYISIFFYAYSSRSVSFYKKMVECNEELKYLAEHDPLTSTLNARAYYLVCDKLIRIAHRDSTPFSVLFIDLDHFKKINDQYGHEAGDQVLIQVATCLRDCIRESDALGRVGGEEFSVFLPNTDSDGARLVAENLRTAIERLEPQTTDGKIRITASIGIAYHIEGQTAMVDIQSKADQAMYHAKQQGRNRVSCLDAG